MGHLLAFLSALTTLFGDITAKVWADKNNHAFFALTILFYLAASVTFPLALKFGKLSVINAFASVIIVVLTTLAGIFLFKEKLAPLQFIGIGLGIIAIILLVVGEK